MANSNFPIDSIRRSFPALNGGDNFVFFDNGAGAQIPQSVLDAVCHHLVFRNVQRGGRYRHSQEVDTSIEQARQSVATLLNAREPSEEKATAAGPSASRLLRLPSFLRLRSTGCCVVSAFRL